MQINVDAIEYKIIVIRLIFFWMVTANAMAKKRDPWNIGFKPFRPVNSRNAISMWDQSLGNIWGVADGMPPAPNFKAPAYVHGSGGSVDNTIRKSNPTGASRGRGRPPAILKAMEMYASKFDRRDPLRNKKIKVAEKLRKQTVKTSIFKKSVPSDVRNSWNEILDDVNNLGEDELDAMVGQTGMAKKHNHGFSTNNPIAREAMMQRERIISGGPQRMASQYRGLILESRAGAGDIINDMYKDDGESKPVINPPVPPKSYSELVNRFSNGENVVEAPRRVETKYTPSFQRIEKEIRNASTPKAHIVSPREREKVERGIQRDRVKLAMADTNDGRGDK